MTDWHREYLDLVKYLWRGYSVYVSNGATNATFERHIWPVIRDARKRLRDNPQTKVLSTNRDKLARSLYEMFEMRTSQDWQNVGDEGNYPDMHKEWLEAADELVEKLSK